MEVRKTLRVTGGTALEGGQRKVIALVGPTGVGKTTNLAKLAALFAVHEHARVGIVTTDTYRVGATDQLRVYANIIDLDMKVVDDPADMKSALRKFEAKDLVLIDTAGGSPFNAEQMADAGQMLAVAQPDETHLLVSAATNLEDLRSIVSHFSVLKPTALFFSKLDETQRYGGLYTLAAESGLPLSYFSTGQQVPDDIQAVTQGVVANLLLEGTESRGGTSTESS
jgi:flagellar biosynthesis protein FlhF